LGQRNSVASGQGRFRPHSEFTRPTRNPGGPANFRPVGPDGQMNDGRFRAPNMLQPNRFRPNLQAATPLNVTQQQQNGYFNQGQSKRGTYFASKIRMPQASIACRDNVELCDDNVVKRDFGDDHYDDACDNDDCLMNEDDVDCNNRFIVPVYVNDIKCTALRDLGNFGPVLVERLLPRKHLHFDKPIKCYGVLTMARPDPYRRLR